MEESKTSSGDARQLTLFLLSVGTLLLALSWDSQSLNSILGPAGWFGEPLYFGALGILLYAVGRNAASVGDMPDHSA